MKLTEVMDRIMGRLGSCFLGVEFHTTPDMAKGGRAGKPVNPYHGKVVKVTRASMAVNNDWHAHLARQAGAASVEVLTSREAWHRPVLDEEGRLTPFAQHKDDATRLYWRVRYLRPGAPQTLGQVMDSSTVSEPRSYYVNTETGEEIAREALEPWLPKRKPHVATVVTETGEVKQVESDFIFLLYGLDTLRAVTLDGQTVMVD